MVVVMVTCQQSQGQGQRSKIRTFDKAVIGSQSPEVEAGVMGPPECTGR